MSKTTFETFGAPLGPRRNGDPLPAPAPSLLWTCSKCHYPTAHISPLGEPGVIICEECARLGKYAQPAPAAGDKLYGKRDIEDLGDYYLAHLDAMTREGLHSKSDIAAELAWRDADLAAARADADGLKRELILRVTDDSVEQLYAVFPVEMTDEWQEQIHLLESQAAALRGALASVENGITIADYEAVLADHRRLVRELDVAIFGDGAAQQASLCDLVKRIPDAFAALTGSAGAGWLPIEEAPRDGTRVLVTWDYSPEWITAAYFDDKDWIETGDPDDGALKKPTHWRPLPPPPAAEGGGQ